MSQHLPSFSEPPIGAAVVKGKGGDALPARSATAADVAMRLVNDGPMYAVIALVGILAMKGQATASEMVITALGALLARSWPRAVQVSSAAAFFLIVGLGVASGGCEAVRSAVRPALSSALGSR